MPLSVPLEYTTVEMGYDIALEQALQEMKGIDPPVVAARSGAEYDYDRGQFKLPFFDRMFLISFPEARIEEAGSQAPILDWVQVLLLHYLLQAKGIPIAGEWVTYRQLPGASFFERRFLSMAIQPLQRAFGDDIESFNKAALAVGGISITRFGDSGFRFLALPKIPMACIFYLGDEEMPSSVNILFDAAAHTHLPTEDLSLIGMYLSIALQKHKV